MEDGVHLVPIEGEWGMGKATKFMSLTRCLVLRKRHDIEPKSARGLWFFGEIGAKSRLFLVQASLQQ